MEYDLLLIRVHQLGGSLLPPAAASANTPSFNEFKVNTVRLIADASGRDVVRMEGFRFGARIPIQTGTAVASNGPAAPIFNYENTGLNTDISMREGEPVMVGLECWSFGRRYHPGDVGPPQLEAIRA